MATPNLPTRFELNAILLIASVLRGGSVPIDRAHASYALIPSGGLYRLEHFMQAEQLLVRFGLATVEESSISLAPLVVDLVGMPAQYRQELLIEIILERCTPTWFYAAYAGSSVATELIPDSDRITLDAIVDDAQRREDLLLSLARRFSDEETRRLGSEGEVFVVGKCCEALELLGRPDLSSQVRRVSTISDQLGYDIVAPTIAGHFWRLEVKTTGSPSPIIRIVISRNEARTGLRDTGWALVACQKRMDGSYELAGWCPARAFGHLLPSDNVSAGSWLSAEVYIERSALNEGLPDLLRGPGGVA